MSEETTSEETSETTGEDDLHRKFREALQQKKGGRSRSTGPTDAEDGKVVGHASAAHKKRQFRRKSG
jgi:hypothetical protein